MCYDITFNINVFSPRDLNTRNLAFFLLSNQTNNPQILTTHKHIYTHTHTHPSTSEMLPEHTVSIIKPSFGVYIKDTEEKKKFF